MSHSIELEARQSDSMPQWFDAAAPWISSLIFHLGVGLLVLFVVWLFMKVAGVPEPLFFPTDVPSVIVGPLPGGGPSGGPGGDPMSRIKNIPVSESWPTSPGSPDIMKVIHGVPSAPDIGGIPVQIGGGHPGSIGDPAPGFGPGGTGIGGGPGSGFFGIKDGPGTGPGSSPGAFRIVYIIDHSGSLLDNFDFLREEVKKSVDNLLPIQYFAVVAFSEDSEILGPSSLQRATLDDQRDLANRIDQLKAYGENDGTLAPFQHAFEKAFALKPQLIYFLTDGAFDPQLAGIVEHLNAHHKVRINTLAFVKTDSRYEEQLKALARDNGGIYKFVSEKDLGH
jgi:hypothetical protein